MSTNYNFDDLYFRLVDQKTDKTFALSRMDRVMGRAYSAALLLSGFETAWNALGQRELLDPLWFWVCLAGMIVAQLIVFASQWLWEPNKIWLRVYGVFTTLLLVLWPLQVTDAALLPEQFQPWVWWTVGIGVLATTLGFGFWGGLLGVLAIPTYWFILKSGEFGGQQDANLAMQETIYTFALAACFSSLIVLLRNRAADADAANQAAAEAAAEKARIDAIEHERQRIDALVHDRVLTTLLLAAKADTKEEQKAVADLSKQAIDALVQASQLAENSDETISIASFFAALEAAVKAESAEIQVEVRSVSPLELPAEVAAAATEATLQAVANSLQHAGPGPIRREVRMRGLADGIKIVVTDDGRGFRMSRVPGNRLGVRKSMIGRMEAIGGSVRIDSAPGKGSNIVIEWERS